jgi:hypothetical protein
MKKIFAVLALVAISGAFANADDKGTEFKFGGQIRERFGWDQNPTFLSSNALSEQHWTQRNQFHVNAISGDKFQAYFNLLHTAVWGGSGQIPTNNPTIGANEIPAGSNASMQSNALQVQEAWLWWKITDMMSLRAGRMSSTYGDGFLISKNDWLDNPLNFEGAIARMSFDFMDLDFGGAVLAAGGFSQGTTSNPSTAASAVTSAGGNTNTNSMANVYAVYAAIKNLPEVVKTVDLAVIQLTGDTGVGGTSGAGNGNPGLSFAPGFSAGNSGSTTAGSYNLTTIGAHIKGDVAMIDYRADGAFQTGKQKGTITNATGATASDVTFTANMIDVEAGINFPEIMKARFGVGYHQDTGNDSTDATANHAYQPLFYELHDTAGYMNFFGFGNLTDIYVKATVQPDEASTYGLMVNLASRSTTNAAYTPLSQAAAGYYINPGTSVAANNTDKALGTEFDLFAKHDYGHGFNAYAQAGLLTLGQYFKQGTYTVGTGYQFIGQIAYNF